MRLAVDTSKHNAGIESITRRLQLKADRKHAWEDPIWFVNEYLGRPTFDKQNEIINSVKDNRRTAVKGANSSGKDYQSGNILNWWQFVHEEAITIVYGPSNRQVKDIIWREARRAFQGSPHHLPGRMYPMAAKFYLNDDNNAEGFSADPNEQTGTGIQGFHSPNTLLIITEAHGVASSEIEALIRLNPHRILLTGNTLVNSGEFYEAFTEKSWLYNGITISAFDTPNIIAQELVVPGLVTQDIIDERALEFGVDSPMYYATILAEFPDVLDDTLVPLSMAIAARGRELEPEGFGILGVDVARYGEDASVLYKRQGPVATKVESVHGKSTMELAAIVAGAVEADQSIQVVVIDIVGIGAGVYDRLREMRLPQRVKLIPFTGGARAHNPRRYANRIAECWWGMSQAFRKDAISIGDDRQLIAQVTSRKYTEQSDRVIKLESKDDIKSRGGRSPDEADALAMTYTIPDEVAPITGGQKSSRWRRR